MTRTLYLLFQRFEYESRWSLRLFILLNCLGKNENKQKEAENGTHFDLQNS